MCIIAAGYRREITESHIRTSMSKNRDGAFILVRPPGTRPRLVTAKSFLVDDILKVFNEADPDALILFHARIATHGTINLQNIHGWEEDGVYFCHNGVLSYKNRGDMTDSETFFRDMFMPIFRANNFEFNEKVDHAVGAVIGTSRFAFYHRDKIMTFGSFIKDEGGAVFSNDGFRERPPAALVYGRGYRGGGCGYRDPSYYDGWDDSFWQPRTEKPKAKPKPAKPPVAAPGLTRVFWDPVENAWFTNPRPAPSHRPCFM